MKLVQGIKAWFTRGLQRAKLLCIWILEPKHGYIAIMGIPGSLFLERITHFSSGGILQIFGTLVIAWQLYRTTRAFNQPNFIQYIKNWLNRCPIKPIIKSGSSSVLVEVGVTAKGHATALPPAVNPSLEERIATLEENIKKQDERINNFGSELSRSIESGITLVQEKLEDNHRQINDIVTTLALGTVNWQAIGLVWLLFGLLFQTFDIKWPQVN